MPKTFDYIHITEIREDFFKIRGTEYSQTFYAVMLNFRSFHSK